MTPNADAIERARLRLDAEVARFLANGERIPCCGPRRDYWTSDDRGERFYAALLCQTCPALGACSQYAANLDPKEGVWAGRDRTPVRRKAAAAVKACSRCRRHLPSEEYARMTAGRDGLQAYCRECAASYWRQWDRRRRRPNQANP